MVKFEKGPELLCFLYNVFKCATETLNGFIFFILSQSENITVPTGNVNPRNNQHFRF